jgi:gliding motility associated protien GldN
MRKKGFLTSFAAIAIALLGFAQPPLDGFYERETPRDGFYDRIAVVEKGPAELPYIRQADVLWERRLWQVIDLREKINQPLYFPLEPNQGRKSLFQVLFDGVSSGELRAYLNDDFTEPRTLAQIQAGLGSTRTVTLQRSFPPYEDYDTIISIPFRPDDIKSFRIKEDWFFDSKRSVLDVRIIGICPVREAINPETGEIIGSEPMFWIYFPEARPLLAKTAAFNPHNSARRISYDDLFLQRLFSAYIMKEDNIFDRRINDYMTGLDMLLEAQRARDRIRNFEHDMWEF